jgi:TRAP-type C4-dicarboxylate transport system permease small subunit
VIAELSKIIRLAYPLKDKLFAFAKGKGPSYWLHLLAIPLLTIMAVVTLVDNMMRNFLGGSLLFAYSLLGLLFGVLVFSSAGPSWRAGEFAKIDLLRRHLPERSQLILSIFSLVLGVGCCVLLIWGGIRLVIAAADTGLRPASIRTPEWLWQMIIPVGTSFLLAEIMTKLIQNIRKLTRER